MFTNERKNSGKSAVQKNKVSKELLAALKNTQKLPTTPYGRFPGETGYSIKDSHHHKVHRRTVNRPELTRVDERAKPPQIKVSAPPITTSHPADDILEEDIEKIAHEKIRQPIKKDNK
jgi:hypothetical protein